MQTAYQGTPVLTLLRFAEAAMIRCKLWAKADIVMRKMLISFYLLCVVILAPTRLHADEFLFVTLDFPPLEYIDEQGEPAGIAVELVQRIMSSLGHKVTIKVYPWARSLAMVSAGQADAIFTAYQTPERMAFLDYSNEVLISQVIALYTRADNQFSFNGNPATLVGKQIGVVSTISYGDRFDAMRHQLSLHRVAELEQNFDKLLLGRIDAFVSNIFVAGWKLQRQARQDQIVRLPTAIEKVPSYIAFSKKRRLTALRDDFDQALKAMKASGEYQALIKQYGIRRFMPTKNDVPSSLE